MFTKYKDDYSITVIILYLLTKYIIILYITLNSEITIPCIYSIMNHD